jgi:hypothetical protein
MGSLTSNCCLIVEIGADVWLLDGAVLFDGEQADKATDLVAAGVLGGFEKLCVREPVEVVGSRCDWQTGECHDALDREVWVRETAK